MEDSLARILAGIFGRTPAHESDAKQPADLPPGGGYVETGNSPYDRLRSSLRRVFPSYPDVFDFHQSGNNQRTEK